MNRKNNRYRYAIVSLDKVNALGPYFNKLGEDGWELVSVDSGKAFFKRIKSTSFSEYTIDYVSGVEEYENEKLSREDSIVEEFL